jgi:Rrf2 family protein
MLTLTRKTDYALIALTHLSQNRETCTSAREIATLYGLPLPLLMNVLKLLGQQGLAKSVRGPKGGYQLALPASEITLHDIILAVEGPIQLVQCIGHESDHHGLADDAHSLDAPGHPEDSEELNALQEELPLLAGGLTSSCGGRSHAGPTAHGRLNASAGNVSTTAETDSAEGISAGGCELECTCPVRHPIHRIQSKLVEFVKSVTLADVAEGNGFCQPNESTRALTAR